MKKSFIIGLVTFFVLTLSVSIGVASHVPQKEKATSHYSIVPEANCIASFEVAEVPQYFPAQNPGCFLTAYVDSYNLLADNERAKIIKPLALYRRSYKGKYLCITNSGYRQTLKNFCRSRC